MTNVERLEREISAQKNALVNAIQTREAHPTYGVTKKSLEKQLNQLRGMVEAWLYVTEEWPYSGRILWDASTRDIVEKKFFFDLSLISMRVSVA